MRLLGERAHLVAFGDVGGNREHTSASTAEVVADLLERVGPPRREHKVGTVVDAPPRQGGAEAGAGAHDHDDLAVDEHQPTP